VTAPLRVVGTPAYRADLIRQVQDLNRISAEHQARADVIGAERKRALAELRADGMTYSEIARATGMRREDVLRKLGVRRSG
jgi:DNA-binding NarL/FixJ family response regulator